MKSTCRQKREVQVLQSGAGFYIGTCDEEGPYCRLSENYYTTRGIAATALKAKTYIERDCIENNACRGTLGNCFY